VKQYDLTSNLGAYLWLADDLLTSPVIHTGEWQSMDTSGSKAHGTHELEDVTLVFDPLPKDLTEVMPFIDHEWADAHFLERVSGTPMNPPPSHITWPYAVGGNAQHTNEIGAFDHTYPERFWPRYAGKEHRIANVPSDQHRGIRFPYGDLNDVVDLLVRSPLTRQAFLPVWFPEDTGAVHGQRVPCTLGYHFMIRDNKISCRYYLRSCDIYRHLSNDVYFAAMLTEWVMGEVNQRLMENGFSPISTARLGSLVVHIGSLHAFVADKPKIKTRLDSIT
jgi:hypothetical protein